jgi:siroheme synthase
MNNKNVINRAVIPGIIAAAAVALSLSVPITLDRVAGFITVLGMIGLAVLEYRLSWKQLFGRR